MREILFRGKRIDNGEWVEGNYSMMLSGRMAIQPIGRIVTYEVLPTTIGQFTGLLDKKGKKIFEGDIVHAVYQSGYIGCKNIDFGIGVVKYSDSYYGGASYQIDIIGEMGSRVFTASLENGVEVIGNVYDNPELTRENKQLSLI